jgi:hypothetical protein
MRLIANNNKSAIREESSVQHQRHTPTITPNYNQYQREEQRPGHINRRDGPRGRPAFLTTGAHKGRPYARHGTRYESRRA